MEGLPSREPESSTNASLTVGLRASASGGSQAAPADDYSALKAADCGAVHAAASDGRGCDTANPSSSNDGINRRPGTDMEVDAGPTAPVPADADVATNAATAEAAALAAVKRKAAATPGSPAQVGIGSSLLLGGLWNGRRDGVSSEWTMMRGLDRLLVVGPFKGVRSPR